MRRRRSALAWGTVALIAQALSCGYYLLFFPPLAALYVLWELARRGRLRDTRTWAAFSIAAVITGVAVAPFLVPYARIHADLQMSRSIEEMQLYAADVYGYLTVLGSQRIWGGLMVAGVVYGVFLLQRRIAVRDGVPVLLEEQAMPLAQIEGP
mgnify:CR=1 FL=1